MQENTTPMNSSIWCCGKLFFADIVNGRMQFECSECACMWATGADGLPIRLGVGPNLVLVPGPLAARTTPQTPAARNGSPTRKSKLA